MYSTKDDMAKFVNFLLGHSPVNESRDDGDSVLDLASRDEMRNIMMIQRDGISGISMGVFETGSFPSGLVRFVILFHRRDEAQEVLPQ